MIAWAQGAQKMAGDWIKMRMDLTDDPAVILIAGLVDMPEDEVVGKLHRLWSWADRHATDGFATGITERWVDRYIGKPGFAAAVVQAKWLEFNESGILFPRFDRHNGESAKLRAENAIRQRLSRANRDKGVTGVARGNIPASFRRAVLERDRYRCVYCGNESSEEDEASSRHRKLSIDHITPETRGGRSSVCNLVACCKLCNNEKNDRTPEEWGLFPEFLAPGVSYKDGLIVTDVSHESRDKTVTREEERREERKDKKKAAFAASDVVVPSELDTPEVRQALTEWLAHKAALGKQYKSPDSAAKLFKKFEGKPPSEFVRAVDFSIGNNYQGLFSPGPDFARAGPEEPHRCRVPSDEELANWKP